MTTGDLVDIYGAIAARVDGAALVAEAIDGADLAGAHVLAVGKVARPMFEGFTSAMGAPADALLIAPDDGATPGPFRVLVSDHPHPTARSVAAAAEARLFVTRLEPRDRLVVLLSGGGSSLLAAPAPGLTLEEKRATVTAVSRAGATIGALNTVRKHLSAIKGGQLGAAGRAETTVLALSDVVGNDPATIASGPFSPDPTTFAQALALVDALAPQAPAAARAHLAAGAAGRVPETPKPGDPRLARVDYRIVAGPERVLDEARRAAAARGLPCDTLAASTEEAVPALADAYAARARSARGSGPRLFVGNGEPRIVVTGAGRGGRSTHLALLMARSLAGLRGVAFLAAGTDRHDGSADAAGAAVDGDTWPRALARGLDPQGALDRCDSAPLLDALGCLVRGPGRSNVLDLHLLAISSSS